MLAALLKDRAQSNVSVFAMKIIALLSLIAVPLFAAPKEAPVTLSLETLGEQRQLKASSMLELRFAMPMVAEDVVGKAVESPLVIKPALAGKWMWLSPKSGVFQPTEPPPLATSFQLTLRGDLKKTDGKSFPGSLKETVSSPSFRVKGWAAPEYFSPENVPTQPRLVLLFNSNLEPNAKSFTFINEAKQRVDAVVEHVDVRKHPDYEVSSYRSDDKSSLTWAQQFHEHRTAGATKKKPADEEEEDGEPAPRKDGPILLNQIVITPAKPLHPGKGWKLVVEKGLASSSGEKLAEAFTLDVGEVKPFIVESVAVENLVNSGKRMVVKFSKPLAKAVKKEPAKWVKVEPAVPNLRVELPGTVMDERDTLIITGDFELAKDYTFTFAGEIPAAEPFTLGQPFTKAVSFAPVPARLYFQGFSEHQQRTGTRNFHLMGVNVKRLRVTAKVVPAESATTALDAWAKYYKEGGEENGEWLQKLDDKSVPGAVAWTKDFTVDAQTDEKKLLALNWDEILGAGKTGLVLLTAEQINAAAPNVKLVGTQALVQVTDLGLVWKEADADFFHVFSLASAEPSAGASLRLVDEKGALLAETKTAADGTARMPKLTDKSPRWLIVTSGEDRHVIRFDGERREMQFGRFRINVWGDEEDIMEGDGYEQAQDLRGIMFSDRPIYRPGETVRVKGIVRSYASGKPHLPAGMKVKLRVKGPRGRLLGEQSVTLSEFGSFDATYIMPPDVTGYYRALLVFGKSDGNEDWSPISHGWSVEEYEPNAFEVKVVAPKSPALSTPLEMSIAAKYYMGKALSKAQLAWSVRASDEKFTPEGFEEFVFANALYDYRLEQKLSGATTFSAQGKVDIGAGGVSKVSFIVPGNAKLPQPRQVRFTSEITDLDQQTVAERTEFTAHSSEFYLGLRRMPDVVREGEALPIQLIAVRNDGSPMLEPVQADVKLTRIEWQTNRVEEADDAENFRSEPQMQFVGQAPLTTAKLEKKGSKWELAAPEKRDESLKVGKPGLYLISAVARDAAGRDVITTTTVHVYGKDQLAWNYRNRFQIELAADKPEYRAGEQATLLVKTPIAGRALVTVERENVRRHFFVNLEGNAPVVRVPLEEADAPNVFVSVLVQRGAQDSTKKFKMPEYRVGYAELRVARPDAKLYVNVKPAQPQVRPGDDVNVLCEVRDIAGKPVVGAEVTLWAADEGVLSLTGFETPDPLAYFSKLMRLDVTTGVTLDHLLGEDPDGRAFENKGYLVGGFGKGGDAAVRRNFLGTAHWSASLRTDEAGNVLANFKAPDGLTRYRVMAVAQSKRDQFGHGESAFEINKPLMLEPSPPRFANVGDQMLARAVLHNTTANAGEVVVRLKLNATASATETEKRVFIAANESVAVDFPVEFRETGEAAWLWSAEFGKLSDTVETKFLVHFPAPVLREVRQSRADADADLLAGLDPALLGGKNVIRVSVSNSRVFDLREGVSELLHYPYGCVEQTTSAMLPWLALRDFRTMLPELNRKDEDFTKAVEKSITHLFKMQTGDGGLGYWPGANTSNFWGSSYAALGLALAKRAGFALPDDDYTRLLGFLSKQLRGATDTNNEWELSPRALACYALAAAGKPEAAYHELLFKKRDKLSQESRALLALAVLESKGSAKMADTLLKMQDKPVAEDFWFGCIARAQGIRLLAWSRLAPNSDGTKAIADALFDERINGHWMTTQGNVWAVLGLAEYIRRTESDRKEVKGALVAGEEETAFKLAAKGDYFEKEFPFGSAPSLKLSNPAKGRVFTNVTIEARPKTLVTERKDRGYAITRRYQRINDDGTLSDLGDPHVGDRVLITLNFTAPGRAGYVVVDDPLPAVFEAVNPEFKTQAMAGAEHANTWNSDYNEFREDRALFFANSLWPGKHEIRYLARVRSAGSATAPPAKIEEMYRPQRFGLGGSEIVKGKGL